MLICDDRAEVRLELTNLLRLGSPDPLDVQSMPHGYALLKAYQATGNSLVLIGIHSRTSAGSEATALLLEMHPTAAPILFGSLADIDLLSATYARGCGGLMIWEPKRS
jgi:FixJ family two-component response regulator